MKKININLDLLSKYSAVTMAFFIPISTVLTHVFFFLSLLLSFISGKWQDNLNTITENPAARFFTLFYLMFMVGVFYSVGSSADIIQVVSKYNKVLLAVFLFPLFTEDRFRNAGLYAFLTAMSLTLLCSYLKSVGLLTVSIHAGSGSVFKSYLTTNLLMAFAVFLFMTCLFDKIRPRFISYLFIGTAIFNIVFLSQGRTGQVVFVVLTLLYLWRKLFWKGLGIGVLALSLLALFAYGASPVFKNRIQMIHQDVAHYQQGQVETSVGLRIDFAKNSIKLINAHPYFGTGTGSFSSQYANIQPAPVVLTTNPHNEYLHEGVQFGVIGLLMLIGLFITQWRCSYQLPDEMQALAQALVLAIAVGCLANSWILDTTEGHFYVFFSALLFASFKKKQVRYLEWITQKTRNRFMICKHDHFTLSMQVFLHQPKDNFEKNIQCYFKNKPNDTTTVGLVTLDSRKYVIKRYNIKNFWHGIKLGLRESRAMTSWKNAHRLLELNIPTVMPIAVIENRWGFIRREAYFISEYIEGKQASDYFPQFSEITDELTRMIQKMAALVIQLKTAFIHHDDLHHFNILFVDHEPILLDLDHMKEYRWFKWRFNRVHQKDLAQLFRYLAPYPFIKQGLEKRLCS